MEFQKIFNDQEDGFCKLVGSISWANPEGIGTQVELIGGRVENQRDLSLIVLGQ